ncbi:MAG: hypothetical protein IPP07_00510 [Holophagales bacterium]|nr:hypothetical protein [Holophagales bacterium]
MPDELSEKTKVLQLAQELESLGVNVRGFLEQARDGERRAHALRKLFEVESFGIAHPPTYAQRLFRHVADELHRDLETSRVLFAPSILWELSHLRHLLWGGADTKQTTADARKALQLFGEALADRRTGTHGRPIPGGRIRRQREDAQLVTLLAKLAAGAVGELQRAKVKKEDTVDNYVRALRRMKFWEAVEQSFHFDPEAPDARASRLAYAKHRLERDIFDPMAYEAERRMEKRGLLPPASPAEAERRRPRPSLGAVVAAMATALLGGEVDPAIFGGSGDADKRATSRSLAIRALRKVRPGNLEIPKR